MGSRTFPYNFIPKIILPKHLIHQYFYIMPNMIIQMHIDACRIAHYRLDSHQILVHPVEVTFLIPNVTIHLFLKRTQLLDIQFAFSLTNSFGHFGIATKIHLFGIIGTAGKGRVNINQVHRDTFVFQVGTSRKAFATKHEISVLVSADTFLQLGFVERHALLDAFFYTVVVAIAEDALGAYKIVEHGLAFQCIGEIGYVFDCHIYRCFKC